MNQLADKIRSVIAMAQSKLDALDDVDERNDEQEERYEKLENCIDALENALDAIE